MRYLFQSEFQADENDTLGKVQWVDLAHNVFKINKINFKNKTQTGHKISITEVVLNIQYTRYCWFLSRNPRHVKPQLKNSRKMWK